MANTILLIYVAIKYSIRKLLTTDLKAIKEPAFADSLSALCGVPAGTI